MKKTCMKLFSLLFCLIALGACEEDPEVLTGNIVGKVTDSSTGEVMHGVTVTITPGGLSRTTGSDGYFEFRDLEPKQYEIQAHKDGYTTNNKTVNVITGYDITGDIQLTPIALDGKLALSVSSLNFGSQNSSMAFSIQNNGNKAFNWNISGQDKANWLSVKPHNRNVAGWQKQCCDRHLEPRPHHGIQGDCPHHQCRQRICIPDDYCRSGKQDVQNLAEH